MSSVFAPVNPALLRWARIESGLEPETVAKRLKFNDASKLEAWEAGKAKPTLRQAERLANIYKRPLGVFFLPHPPAVPPLAAEYRRLPGIKPGQEPPELRLALRRLQRSRAVALDLLEETREPIQRFGLRAHSSEPPEEVALRLRHALQVTVEEQKAFGSEYVAWRTWRDRTERLGALVFQISGVPLEQARGVSILSDPLPVIGINSKETPDSRPFTLLHELVHLMLKKAGEERAAAEDRHSESEWQQIERFADAVSAATLLPAEAILDEPLVQAQGSDPAWPTEEITRLARKYRVTPLALMMRLVHLGQMNWAYYHEWRRQWEMLRRNRSKKSSEGGPSRVETILSRVGPRFASLVLRSLDQNVITGPMASDYLDLKPSHFKTLRDELASRQSGPISS